jgi:hypothetical protein
MKTETALQKTKRLKKEIEEREAQINLIENLAVSELAIEGLKNAGSLNCIFDIQTANFSGLWGNLFVPKEFSACDISEKCGAKYFPGSVNFSFNDYTISIELDDGVIHFSVYNEINTNTNLEVAIKKHVTIVNKLGLTIGYGHLIGESNCYQKKIDKINDLIKLLK